MIDEPIHFTSILQQDEKFIFSAINNLVYFYHKNPVTNDSNKTMSYTFKTLTNLKGLIFSRNQLLKIAVGSAIKQKNSATNIVILTNIKYTMPAEEILLKMIKSFQQKIYKNMVLKEPLNFDDLLCILSENHDVFIELVAFIKALLEEQNNLESFAKIKKFSVNKQTLINTKKKIEEMIANKEMRMFILGRLFFTILMIHKEDFEFFLNDTKKKFLISFYKNVLNNNNFNEIERKNEESKDFLIKIKENLAQFIKEKIENSMEIEKFCKICKKNAVCDHLFMKCILTQEDIYLEKFFLCSYCKSGVIDVEHEFKLKNEDFDLYFNVCPLCLHLLKRPLCEI